MKEEEGLYCRIREAMHCGICRRITSHSMDVPDMNSAQGLFRRSVIP